MLAALPDSLQPHVIVLDTLPKPITIRIPTDSNASVENPLFKGFRHKVFLQPPYRKMLPVLQDFNGQPVTDSTGNSFIMGDGGVSSISTFTTDNGLASDAILCSKMDKAGNLWFGTNGGGVSRFDGKSFTTFSKNNGLVGSIVTSICEDKKGNLWFGTIDSGVSRYDGSTFTNYSTKQGLVTNFVFSIIEDRSGKIWIATGGGASCFDGKSFTTFSTAQGLASGDLRCIIEDNKGNLWFATAGNGVSCFDGKKWITYNTTNGLPNNAVWGIKEDKSGNLWFITDADGVCRFDGSKFTNYSSVQGWPNRGSTCLTEDQNGNLWFGTIGGGVTRFDGKSFVTYTKEQGLPSNFILSITEDKSGNMWFGTRGDGICRLDKKSFVTFTSTQGIPNYDISCLAGDRTGNLWIGTGGGGVSRYDGKSFTAFSVGQGLGNISVDGITADKVGNLWFATWGGGASYYDGKNMTTFGLQQGLPSGIILSICSDQSGTIWMGTLGQGLVRFDGKTMIRYTTAQGLGSNDVNYIYEDHSGILWFASNAKGVCRFDGKSFIHLTSAQGLAANTVGSMIEDQTGNLWFATPSGLSVMRKKDVESLNHLQELIPDARQKTTASNSLFKSFKKAEGLPDDQILQVLQLPDGRMAVGTGLGIALFNTLPDLEKLADIEIYNRSTDYPIKHVNGGQRAMFLDQKGILWASTGTEKSSLVRIDPSLLHNDHAVPRIIIKGIRINEEAVCWNDLIPGSTIRGSKPDGIDSNVIPANITEEVVTLGTALSDLQRDSMRRKYNGIEFDSITPFYPLPMNLVLPYEYNRVTINFNAVETGKPGLINYQYRLDGYDDNWSVPGKNTIASFGNIREGKYTFKVRAQGPDGIWGEPVNYSFKVLAPWYRTLWANALYALLLLAAFRIFSSLREQKLKRDKLILEKTVADRTQELVVEKKKSDDLLRNILPEEIAEELKSKGKAEARLFDEVSVLFTDFVGFTGKAGALSPKDLVQELNTCFSAFDTIIERNGLEKIKTIGDAYMAVCGLPASDPLHAQKSVAAAKEIRTFMAARKLSAQTFDIRIGINSGSVVAGIVGVKKFAYDIWGDTVNIANRMEQNSEAGKINISETTYEIVKDQFPCSYRGELEAKGKGVMKMYFVD